MDQALLQNLSRLRRQGALLGPHPVPMDEALLRTFLQSLRISDNMRAIAGGNLRPWKYHHLAGCVIGWCLGTDWTQRHLLSHESPAAYFRSNFARDERINRYIARVGHFGELLYNLQKVEGFEDRLESIRRADGDGVEAGIAELTAGELFEKNSILFRFVKATPVKGTSYDIEYVTTDGRVGRCEVKSKLQSNELTANGIVNILKTAKAQLPKGTGTGMVMLRIPEEWWDTATKLTGLNDTTAAIEQFFATEKTTRISSVLVVQHRTVIAAGKMGQYLLCKEHDNPHCPVRSGLPRLRESAAPPDIWTNLLSLVDP